MRTASSSAAFATACAAGTRALHTHPIWILVAFCWRLERPLAAFLEDSEFIEMIRKSLLCSCHRCSQQRTKNAPQLRKAARKRAFFRAVIVFLELYIFTPFDCSHARSRVYKFIHPVTFAQGAPAAVRTQQIL